MRFTSTKSMGWDVLNRMTSFTSGSTTTDYAYRADGMRVSKASGTQSVTYGYDGQMQVEECFTDSGAPSTDYTTRYGLGARGIDRMETTNGSGTSVGYPVYDSHGNMFATLAESGTSYSLGNQRGYDAWGGVRSGSTTGGPSPRHCASLGHVQDDESGLVYMRARYYDAGSARFIAEDPEMSGQNWFCYCGNDPVNYCDNTGRSRLDWLCGLSGAALLTVLLTAEIAIFAPPCVLKKVLILSLLETACLESIAAYAMSNGGSRPSAAIDLMFIDFAKVALSALAATLDKGNAGFSPLTFTIAAAFLAETVTLEMFCFFAVYAGDPVLDQM